MNEGTLQVTLSAEGLFHSYCKNVPILKIIKNVLHNACFVMPLFIFLFYFYFIKGK